VRIRSYQLSGLDDVDMGGNLPDSSLNNQYVALYWNYHHLCDAPIKDHLFGLFLSTNLGDFGHLKLHSFLMGSGSLAKDRSLSSSIGAGTRRLMTCAAQLPDRISLFALITKASVLTDIGKRPIPNALYNVLLAGSVKASFYLLQNISQTQYILLVTVYKCIFLKLKKEIKHLPSIP